MWPDIGAPRVCFEFQTFCSLLRIRQCCILHFEQNRLSVKVRTPPNKIHRQDVCLRIENMKFAYARPRRFTCLQAGSVVRWMTEMDLQLLQLQRYCPSSVTEGVAWWNLMLFCSCDLDWWPWCTKLTGRFWRWAAYKKNVLGQGFQKSDHYKQTHRDALFMWCDLIDGAEILALHCCSFFHTIARNLDLDLERCRQTDVLTSRLARDVLRTLTLVYKHSAAFWLRWLMLSTNHFDDAVIFSVNVFIVRNEQYSKWNVCRWD